MNRLEVHKFGGTSVADADHIRAVAGLMADQRKRSRLVVVSSATSGTTDSLVKLGSISAEGRMDEVETLIDQILGRHLSILRDLEVEDSEKVELEIRGLVEVIRRLSGAVGIHGELTPRVHDRIVAKGEKIAVRLIAAALAKIGVPSVACDADGFIETDDRFGEASPLPDVTDEGIQNTLIPLLDKGVIPVVTGYCGKAPDGATTTFGRGGSDLSATLVAAALGADEVTIWTDVDGVMSANPKVVPDAQVIPWLNYREAAEMSFYGAKVLHQRTMIPVASRNIPVRTRNTENPPAPGTVVDNRVTPGTVPVKAVSAVPGHALLSIEGKGMAGVPGFSARLFGVLARQRISVTMYSQSSSEASICLAVPSEHVEIAVPAIKEQFHLEFHRGDVEQVVVRPDVSLVAVVGLGMAHTPGTAGSATGALGRAGINILAIAQGSSELNITLAVNEADADEALRVLHRAFGLHRMETGALTPDGLDLILLGMDVLGRDLARLVVERRGQIKERFGLNTRIVAVADAGGYVLEPGGIDQERIHGVLSEKEGGADISKVAGGRAGNGGEAVRAALGYRLCRPILVDTTPGEEDEHGTIQAAFRKGCDVVTAYGKPVIADLKSLPGLLDSFRTELFKAIPYVVTGHADGAEVTAASVFDSMLSVVERREGK